MLELSINWNPSPELFKIGGFAIRYYSLMFIIAFVLGLQLMKKMYIADKISLEHLDPLFMYVVIATILGARLGHVFFYDWAYFQNHLSEILLPIKHAQGQSILFGLIKNYTFTGFAGLASHGAAIGIIASLYYYSKKVIKKPLLFILDRVGIVVALAGFFIRIGNLFNSEIIGKPTHSNFGIVFQQLGEDFPRHPTQLYEAFSYLIIFFILWRIYWKTDKKQQQGYLFGVFFALLWSVRFLIEFLKEPQIEERTTWLLNTGQWLSIPLVLIGIYFAVSSAKRHT
ncbi:MAG: prolipoprotein diacylglyceryl transferase [Flavobacteriales bacterium]|jgi:phosphatidylglycerol---prolipoprotein diacylglyceryl transferase|nr:prolipoprotein diacylglyceryl transferase [Flavobacteriales bacterium]